MARDALALADELELDSFHLLGISMGGAIAQEIALQAPGRVRTLTLAVTFSTGGDVLAQARRGLGRAREADQPRAAHGRADADEPLGGVLREPGHGGVRPHGDAPEPAPAAARGLLPPARRLQLPRHARPPRLPHDADAGDRRGARHPRADLEVAGDRRGDPGREAERPPGALRTASRSSAPRSSTRPCSASSARRQPRRPRPHPRPP